MLEHKRQLFNYSNDKLELKTLNHAGLWEIMLDYGKAKKSQINFDPSIGQND